MADSMVTGRISEEKKAQGTQILRDDGLTASQAIKLMFDRIISEQSASFLLTENEEATSPQRWKAAARFIDSIPTARKTRFDDMTKKQAKLDRLQQRGLL